MKMNTYRILDKSEYKRVSEHGLLCDYATEKGETALMKSASNGYRFYVFLKIFSGKIATKIRL